jgi:hypothetical protein
MPTLLEVRDRDGEMATVTDPDAPAEHTCVDGTGFGPEDDDGRQAPCLVCRPHLRGAYGPGKRFAYGARFATR